MGSNPCAGEDFLCGISVNVHSPNLTKRVCHLFKRTPMLHERQRISGYEIGPRLILL